MPTPHNSNKATSPTTQPTTPTQPNMLPLLKRYSDDIRAAMVMTERTFCDKLIGELGQLSKLHGAIGNLHGSSGSSGSSGALGAVGGAPSDTCLEADSKLTELSEERAAILACPGVPFLATLKDLDEEDKTIVDDLILND